MFFSFNINFLSTRKRQFTFHIVVVSPDDGRNCRPKYDACVRDK